MKTAAVALGMLLMAAPLAAQQVPHPVNGPATSTVDTLPVWQNTSGSSLKAALDTIVKHTGGVQLTDTTAPTVPFNADQMYGLPTPPHGYAHLDWKAKHLFQLDDPSTHAGIAHSTMAILSSSVGSGNGPTQNDLALVLGCNKLNWLSTTIDGEQDCQFAWLTQGRKGDAAVYLASNRHVDDPLTPHQGMTAFEATVSHVRPSEHAESGKNFREFHPSVGYGITGFQDVTAVTAGTGNVCRLTIQNTAALTSGYGMTVHGIRGPSECNGYWGFTVFSPTQVDLTNSVLVHPGTHVAGSGAAGTTIYALGGPNFGFEARAQTGQNGIAFLASRGLVSTGDTSWGSAIRVRQADDGHVAFDMSFQSGRFVVQDPTRGTMLDENYSATFLNGPVRWAGNTTAMPRDNPQSPGTDFPGGGALGFNYLFGNGEVDLWNLYPAAAATLILWQKTGPAAQAQVASFALSGSSISSQLAVTGTLSAALTTVGAGTGKHFVCVDPATGTFYRGTAATCN